MKNFFKNIFWNYAWIGVAILLFSIFLDLKFPTPREMYLSIIINFIEAIGLSILISSIFTSVAESKKFISNMQNLLESIIIKRNFLSNIDSEGKKSALKSLIQPTAEELRKYPNIGDYYEYFINKTLSISEKSVRSNYTINSRAYFDNDKNRIAIEGTYSYRLFPNSKGYLPIVAGFHQPKSIGSRCIYIHATDRNGERKSLDKPELKETTDNSGLVTCKTELDISEFGKNHEHLSVELKVVEIGGQTEQLLQFTALQPTDGFRFELHCEKNISILDKAIFVVGAQYYVDLSDDKKNITITCNQWINEGSGIAIMLQYDESEEQAVA
jgi:hypothetical protein